MMLRPGSRAPDFHLPVVSLGEQNETGETIWRLGEKLALGPVFLVFAKEGCPTCAFGLPLMDRVGRRCDGGPVNAAFVAQESPFAAARMIREWGLKTPVLLDPDPHPVSESFGPVYVPSGFWINPEGIVEHAFESFQRGELEEIYRKAAAAAGTAPPPLFGREEFVPAFRPG